MKIRNKAIVILLVVGLSAMMTIPTALACTTRTPGYWKNHPDQWVIAPSVTPLDGTGIWIGEDVSLAQALEILKTPVQGSAKINLEQKLIAAALSFGKYPGLWNDPALFPGTPTMNQLYKDGCALIYNNPGDNFGPKSPNRATALQIAGNIDQWLNFYDAD